jgi:Zn-dependent M28 family amino/carboxypeptidase
MRRRRLKAWGWLTVMVLAAGCGNSGAQTVSLTDHVPADPDLFVTADSVPILDVVRALAHDSMEGRQTGTPGGERAQSYLLAAFQEVGLHEPPGGFLQPFEFVSRRNPGQPIRGANIVGFVPGREPELGAIVLTAHFDHMGIRAPRPGTPAEASGDSIYNGADDNGSGTAGILSLARYFLAHHPRHTMVFAALDAEEMGLAGAREFVARDWPPNIVLNVNLDMISRSDSLLYAVGTFHYPHLRPILEGVQPRPPVVIRFGHDQPGLQGVPDWTGSSDHRAFHARGIPFIYFGVDDHEDYHRPGDEFERIDPGFFLNAVRTILAAVLALDASL